MKKFNQVALFISFVSIMITAVCFPAIALSNRSMPAEGKGVPASFTSQATARLYFASPQESIPIITELLRKEDWKTLSAYYDLSNFKIQQSELESGRFFINDQRPEGSHPGLPWKYKHPFAPGFKFSGVNQTDEPNVVLVNLEIEIDEGGGMVQRGFSEFKMRKGDHGYQLLPPDGPAAETDTAEYVEVLRRIAVKIEALGRTYPHLAKFSVEKNVRGLKLETELRILYYNGVRDVPNPRYEEGRKVSKLIPAYAESDGIELILNLMTEEQANSGQRVVLRTSRIGNRVVDLTVEGENTIAIKEIREKIHSIIKDEKAYFESRHAK